MASDKTIEIRIDVTKINKDWLFKGEKGVYMDLTLYYNKEQDQFGQNGMVKQKMPSDIYKAEKELPKEQKTKNVILGNAKEWTPEVNREAMPGAPIKETEGNVIFDDLPF